MRPLAGVRVLACPAAPHATAVLAALGADVVMVRQAGSADGGWPAAALRRRQASRAAGCTVRAVTLDLAAPAGQDIAARLASVADVVVEGLPAAATERLGLGRAATGARNPGLVHCSTPSMAPGSCTVAPGPGVEVLTGQTDEVIEDWLGGCVADIERLRLEGAFG